MVPGSTIPIFAMSVAEAAEHLSFDKSTIYRLIRSGQLITFKVGRKRFITFSSLDTFVAKRWPENHDPEGDAWLMGELYKILAAQSKLQIGMLVPTAGYRETAQSAVEGPRTPKT